MKGFNGFKYRHFVLFVAAALNANKSNRKASSTPLQKPPLPIDTTDSKLPK